MAMQGITLSARIMRKQEALPRYVVVKPDALGGRRDAFPADVMLNDAGPFRRMIRPWGRGSDVFFFNLTAAQCAKAGLDTNDVCTVTIIPEEE